MNLQDWYDFTYAEVREKVIVDAGTFSTQLKDRLRLEKKKEALAKRKNSFISVCSELEVVCRVVLPLLFLNPRAASVCFVRSVFANEKP